MEDVQWATHNGLQREVVEGEYDVLIKYGKKSAEAQGLTVGGKVCRLSCSPKLALPGSQKAVSPRRVKSSPGATR